MQTQLNPGIRRVVVVVAALLGSCASAPRGAPGPAADALAARIENAVNLDAWNQLAVVSWVFGGSHQWLWDRARGFVRLQDDQGTVLLDAWDRGGFVVDNEGGDVLGARAGERLQSAWAAFINDSFWLNPFATLRNQGARRELLDIDGVKALLIRYEGGGITPGDSYAFFVDDTGLPTRWKLWVQVVPFGFQTSFEEWIDVDGARLAANHKAAGIGVSSSPIKGGKTLKDAGAVDDPFARLLARRH